MYSTNMKKAIRINKQDNVATALNEFVPGDIAQVIDSDGTVSQIYVREAIPFGHKFAIDEINSGAVVIKYGEIIGMATGNIIRGYHVHTHNVVSQRGKSGGNSNV